MEDAEMKRSSIGILPEGLVEEILVRLPAESLVRFKSVCKSWHALINDRSFAYNHLRRSLHRMKVSPSTSLLLDVCYKEKPGEMGFSVPFFCCHKQAISRAEIYSKDDNGNDVDLRCVVDERDLTQCLKTILPLDRRSGIQSVVSHCNGIVCVRMVCCSFADIVLCNPALKEVKYIYRSRSDLPSMHSICGMGFGYDSRGDDYKLVTITCSVDRLSALAAGATATFKAFLYTLGTDSWKEIKFDLEMKFIFLDNGVYCKGVYYWKTLRYGGSEGIVLAFDMSEEEFHSIPMPSPGGIEEDQRPKFGRTSIALWKESVVMFNLVEDLQHSRVLEMWVMADKFGCVDVDASWTKLLTIRPPANMKTPLEFWKDDELIVECSDRDIFSCIVSYNLYTKEVRTIPIDRMVSAFTYHVNSYVNSLVSIKRGNVCNC